MTIPITAKRVMRVLLAIFMVAMGIFHWAFPSIFANAVPDYLPARLELTLISGVFEVLGGVGLLISRVRKWAAWGLVVLYVAVYPANIYMAMHPHKWVTPAFEWLLYARLPLQILLIAWAAWMARD